MGYKEVYESWQADPDGFWMVAAQAIDWDKAPSKALFDENAPLYEWFSDGMVNTCWNAVDRHAEGDRADQVAIIYDSPITGRTQTITFAELKERVSRFAGGLAQRGITKGDRVIIYMPMVPEALIAMLAVTRIGAIHSVVFGGFAAHELAVRIDDATPKAIIAASAGTQSTGSAASRSAQSTSRPSIMSAGFSSRWRMTQKSGFAADCSMALSSSGL